MHLGVPEHVDSDLRQVDRVGPEAEVERFGQALGQALGHRGQHVRSLQQMAHADVVRDGQPHGPFNTRAADQVVDLAVAGAGRHDDQVLRRLEVFQ